MSQDRNTQNGARVESKRLIPENMYSPIATLITVGVDINYVINA